MLTPDEQLRALCWLAVSGVFIAALIAVPMPAWAEWLCVGASIGALAAARFPE